MKLKRAQKSFNYLLNMDQIFIEFGQILSAESNKKDSIRTHCKGLDEHARSLQASVSLLASELSQLPAVQQQLTTTLHQVKELFAQLESGIDAGEYYKYKGLWQNYIRDFTMVYV